MQRRRYHARQSTRDRGSRTEHAGHPDQGLRKRKDVKGEGIRADQDRTVTYLLAGKVRYGQPSGGDIGVHFVRALWDEQQEAPDRGKAPFRGYRIPLHFQRQVGTRQTSAHRFGPERKPGGP